MSALRRTLRDGRDGNRFHHKRPGARLLLRRVSCRCRSDQTKLARRTAPRSTSNPDLSRHANTERTACATQQIRPLDLRCGSKAERLAPSICSPLLTGDNGRRRVTPR
jgi:hypothetical protein